MKTLLVGLIALGSISAFAQTDFRNPKVSDSYILASSNKGASCDFLVGSRTSYGDKTLHLKAYNVETKVLKGTFYVWKITRKDPTGFISLDNKLRTVEVTNPKVISNIEC